jgi:predicted kinase
MKKIKKVIVGIGISGSGKSTYLEKYASDNGYTYICVDDIREELTGDAMDQSVNSKAWEIAYERVGAAMEKGESIVFDSTMVSGQNRKDFCNLIKASKYFESDSGQYLIKAVVFNTPLEVALQRNSSRDRQVPTDVIERQHQMLYTMRPLVTDGFDTLQTIESFESENMKNMPSSESSTNKIR